MSVEELARSFPYPPLLKFAGPLSNPGRELGFDLTSDGWDKRNGGSVSVIWQRSTEYFDYDALEIAEKGGFVVETHILAPGSQIDMQALEEGDKQIVVRGYKAYMVEKYKEMSEEEAASWRTEGRRNLRQVNWLYSTADGRTLSWRVFNDSRLYSEEDTVHVLDAMLEVGS